MRDRPAQCGQPQRNRIGQPTAEGIAGEQDRRPRREAAQRERDAGLDHRFERATGAGDGAPIRILPEHEVDPGAARTDRREIGQVGSLARKQQHRRRPGRAGHHRGGGRRRDRGGKLGHGHVHPHGVVGQAPANDALER